MRKNIAGALLATVVLVAGGLFYWLAATRDEAPEPELSDTTVPETTSVDTLIEDEIAPEDNIKGKWTLQPASSKATYIVTEELRGLPDQTAIGETNQVTGELFITDDGLTQTQISVDLVSITSDSAERDKIFRDVLDTANFPNATFELTDTVTFGEKTSRIDLTTNGELTLKGVTKPVEVSLQTQINDDRNIEVIANIEVEFAEFGVENPSNVIAKVSDVGTILAELTFTREQ